MYESGIIKILLRLYTPIQNVKVTNMFNPVALVQMTPICMVVALGGLISILMVLLERLKYAHASNKGFHNMKFTDNKYLKKVVDKQYLWSPNVKQNVR